MNSPHLMLVGDDDLGRGHTGHQDLGPWPQTFVWVWKMPRAPQAAVWAGGVQAGPSSRGPICCLSCKLSLLCSELLGRVAGVKAEGKISSLEVLSLFYLQTWLGAVSWPGLVSSFAVHPPKRWSLPGARVGVRRPCRV